MSAVIYPTTNLKATEQLVIERGEGVYVYDNKGKRYLEGSVDNVEWISRVRGREVSVEAAEAFMCHRFLA